MKQTQQYTFTGAQSLLTSGHDPPPTHTYTHLICPEVCLAGPMLPWRLSPLLASVHRGAMWNCGRRVGGGGDNQPGGLESRPLEHLYPLLAVGCQTKWGVPKCWFHQSH